ncbi:MAG: 50S ribosomal protein L5 [Candidatus Nealsonbacteria bacterium CG_4_9_14_3_um_filter_35_11]|uniref:Large ribosomal subunit protein uL5 n=2 Tax=Candidatus Nealsoniibacteriota TaxID=1817911 RepID=A0A2M7DB45_9BACT|nr:MAG: 50S ribosomal protein L5 [Candidatus Nealsonbacteria bacterium CG11_big_fil_rev_8_21_14_0_20_35_11]PIV45676.1 MAG: 50S ribosomal protein L5 [Candidatus Nealsonbacteria bacterium CG02_land_8_20_14_3_00_34_20]PIW92818.1 MAG: 50S ribosomal protein L5 [Candidatus Nealsonbacteria bacterium CG_4_8_14_3_um_filter_34_13]PIZ90123.1 MAG: 50S ribosomal protein L5 [Candidatus Nealsonbacteria bacterium CG_4_10_14_0_2_um_filter_35_20]PJA84440.1 MAG: 50S ribosomal protein L5 [Candidatus Nealsonbacteri
MLRLKDKYKKEAVSAMKKKFGYRNIMAVPKIEKVVINTGLGKLSSGKTAEEQKKLFNYVIDNLSQISGQRVILTKAKKSISSFKTRKGGFIGGKVTLRGRKMHDFLEKLIHIVLPRSRDFQGISPASFDKNGNLNIGIKEHIAFPEIFPERAPIILGLEVTVVTTAKNKEEGIELLRLLGFPIKH